MKIISLLCIFIVTNIAMATEAKPAPVSRIKQVTEADIQMSELMLRKAAKLNNVWRDTEKLIESAKAALAKNDFNAARDLASEALYQAELAIEQASKYKNLEFPAYFK
jgi:hypothetical protein